MLLHVYHCKLSSGKKKSHQMKTLGDGENVTFFQTTGVCHHGDPPVFCEND